MAEALAAIRHRGPDQQGAYHSPHVAMGAVRLRIIDLAGGDQPVFSEDQNTVAVFNGEIYNHAELRRELESAGRAFHSRCDTEVVLQAWLEWGNDCFRRFRGMFAAALWQERERRLVLARDRLGIKPLYIYRHGRDLHFGSELKALFAHPAVPRRIDPRALSDFLSLNYIPAPRTMAAGIEKLPAGHWLEWRGGQCRSEAFWRLDFRPRPRLSEEDALLEFDALMRSSLREHMVADVPVGVWLSGGLDSSAIVHYASAESQRPLRTYSIVFPGRSFDERPFSRLIASRYGTVHEEIPLTPDLHLAGVVEQLPYFCDEPGGDAGALPVWYLSEHCRRGVTVALSGEGADELFGGYLTYQADRYARWMRLLPAPLRKLLLEAALRLPVSDEKIGFEYKLKRFLEGSLLDPVEAHFFWNGSFSREQKQRLLARAGGHPAPSRLARRLPPAWTASGYLNRFLWLDQLYYLADDILLKCDRMSMAHSIEVRPPFLDHRIAEFAASLPEWMKIRGSSKKYLLRRLMKDKLPREILSHRKEGLDIPAHEWFRGPLRELLMDHLTESAVRASGLFRWEAVSSLMKDHMARRVNAGYHLWALLTLFLWARKWNIEMAPEAAAGDSLEASLAI